MQAYEMLKEQDIRRITKGQLASMYNDAIEHIWDLERRIKDLHEENDSAWEAYEDVSNKLYG